MEAKRYYLILAICTACLCICALGEEKWFVEPEPSGLIGRANPTLAGIRKLNVTIVPPYADPNEGGLVWKELESKIVSKLKKAGITSSIKIEGKYSIWSYYVPEIRVYIDMLKLEDLQKYVFRIQTSLATKVHLMQVPNRHIEADVWKTEPKMQAVSVKDMPAEVTGVVLEQVEAFTYAYFAANPPSDANEVNKVSRPMAKKLAGPVTKSAVAKYKYVASKNSKVFHKPDCSSARRIKPENLTGYNSRDEAIKGGKRPCKICKP
ncbi:MAG: Ada metal-binding domain-containing protein [Sedimentisphaerales bacterium]